MTRRAANTNMTTAKLPSLNALRALEAVARNRSFRRAADELFVTPAAITHQIKLLEEFFGFTLLERHSRGIELTEATKAALPQLQRGFDSLSAAVGTLRNHEQVPQLTVGASPTLASRWLMPRLQGFLSQFPGIDVRLEANSRPGTRQSKRDIDIDSPTLTLQASGSICCFGSRSCPCVIRTCSPAPAHCANQRT